MKSVVLLSFLLCLSFFVRLHAQAVAINGSGATATPSSILDVSSTTKGMLLPRMTFVERNAIGSPATGLLIYQTDGSSGFWYYTGATWIRLGNGDGTVTSVATTAPMTGGTFTTTGTIGITQSGTSSNGYLSATDWNTFNNKIGGSGVATRVAFWNATNTLSSNGNLYWDDINSRLGIGTAAPGFTLDVTSAGRTINSASSSTTNAAVFGFNIAAAGAGAGGYGIAGQTNQSGSSAVRAEQINAGGIGMQGINFAASGAGIGTGVYGQTTQSAGNGMDARNLNTSGTGIFAAGQNAAGTYLVAGSGASINGVTNGVHARNTSLGISQAVYCDNGGVICRVDYWSGTVQYKILGTGTVSTTAEGLNGDRVTLHCTEGPEILFEDYGQGKLVNGRTHVEIDPIIAKNILVNEQHPLRVYIQLEGECNGVFVTNKTATSFDVVELANGHSNIAFQYHLIGNRADEALPGGRISRNADARFEAAPAPLETAEIKSVTVGEPTQAPSQK